jgi:hypothetical protein
MEDYKTDLPALQAGTASTSRVSAQLECARLFEYERRARSKPDRSFPVAANQLEMCIWCCRCVAMIFRDGREVAFDPQLNDIGDPTIDDSGQTWTDPDRLHVCHGSRRYAEFLRAEAEDDSSDDEFLRSPIDVSEEDCGL